MRSCFILIFALSVSRLERMTARASFFSATTFSIRAASMTFRRSLAACHVVITDEQGQQRAWMERLGGVVMCCVEIWGDHAPGLPTSSLSCSVRRWR